MSLSERLARAWTDEMTPADRVRVVMACGFPAGAILHVGWLIYHGGALYRGPAPAWAPAFWYAISVIDFVVFWLLITRPKTGLVAAVATMITTVIVNWTQFPTFEFQFNYVLLGITAFGIAMTALAPWLWRRARWRFDFDAR